MSPSTHPATRRPNWTAMTLEDYRSLDLTRPLTDSPIGRYTSARREVDAEISAAMPSTPKPGGPR
jgi:hypothetical protein